MWYPICRYTRPEDSYAVGSTVQNIQEVEAGATCSIVFTTTCTLFVEIVFYYFILMVFFCLIKVYFSIFYLHFYFIG